MIEGLLPAILGPAGLAETMPDLGAVHSGSDGVLQQGDGLVGPAAQVQPIGEIGKQAGIARVGGQGGRIAGEIFRTLRLPVEPVERVMRVAIAGPQSDRGFIGGGGLFQPAEIVEAMAEIVAYFRRIRIRPGAKLEQLQRRLGLAGKAQGDSQVVKGRDISRPDRQRSAEGGHRLLEPVAGPQGLAQRRPGLAAARIDFDDRL